MCAVISCNTASFMTTLVTDAFSTSSSQGGRQQDSRLQGCERSGKSAYMWILKTHIHKAVLNTSCITSARLYTHTSFFRRAKMYPYFAAIKVNHTGVFQDLQAISPFMGRSGFISSTFSLNFQDKTHLMHAVLNTRSIMGPLPIKLASALM